VSGALGGAVVSYLAASAIAERGERGRNRAAARRAVRHVVGAYSQEVTLSSLRRGAGPADQLRAATSERQVRLARDVLEAAEDLGRVRGWLTRRALTALVGPLHVGMARDLPSGDFVGDAVRASLWFKANEDLVKRHIRRPGLLDAAERDQTSDEAWERTARGVRQLLRCV
jgi:hypothetical protein